MLLVLIAEELRFMLFWTSDFLFYLNIHVTYIGMTVPHRFYKYVCIHYIIFLNDLHYTTMCNFFTGHKVDIK